MIYTDMNSSLHIYFMHFVLKYVIRGLSGKERKKSKICKFERPLPMMESQSILSLVGAMSVL
jgi:hypothetical protein